MTAHSRSRLTGEQRDPHAILCALVHAADSTIPDNRIRDALRIRIQRFRDSLVRVPPQNVLALNRLRAAGFRLGLISNADAMEVAAWPDSPLAGLFDVEIFSCDVGCVKPEPAIYWRCLEGLGLSAGDCLFVGDGGSNELVGARDVGLTTVFVSGVVAELWPDRVPQRLAVCDHHVEWMPDVLGLLTLEA